MGELTMGLIGLAVVLGVFLILREFWCWYWKLNKITANQEKQTFLLKRMVELLEEKKL